MKVIHIITGLNNGGAEGVLFRLCKYDNSSRHIVVSLMDEGKYGSMLKSEGIDVFCLGLPSGKITLSSMWQLFKILRFHKPDVVQTWMYHADMIGGLVARISGVKNVFWNIRHTTFEPGKSKKLTIFISKFCSYLSFIMPRKVVCCADEAMRVHTNIGYDQSKMVVVSNGYDLCQFQEDSKLRIKFRNAISVKPDDILLGMVGRFDPQKDHSGLLRALSIVKRSTYDFKFALIGRDLNEDNHALVNEIDKYDLKSNIYLLDQRTDIPSIMNALDVHILSSSFGEGFPNVIAEAMACGTPCITTDVGDAAFIVGDTGWVVPPQIPEALSDSILQVIEEKQRNPQGWLKRKYYCRKRIVDKFSIETMIKNYHDVWGSFN